jgi:hypothetical protein
MLQGILHKISIQYRGRQQMSRLERAKGRTLPLALIALCSALRTSLTAWFMCCLHAFSPINNIFHLMIGTCFWADF